MTNRPITARTHPMVQRCRQIRDGKIPAQIFCEGESILEELLKSKYQPSTIYCTEQTLGKVTSLLTNYRRDKKAIMLMSDSVMKFASDLSTPPGIIAIALRPTTKRDEDLAEKDGLIVVLHGLQLPQNVGAVLRTAEASGVTDVWLTEGTSDAFGPKAIRASAGSVLRIQIHQDQSLNQIVDKLTLAGFQIFAAIQDGAKVYHEVDWSEKKALVIGAEGPGFSPDELSRFKDTIRIPMEGQVESLNVGVAAAVCLFEAARQRRKVKVER